MLAVRVSAASADLLSSYIMGLWPLESPKIDCIRIDKQEIRHVDLWEDIWLLFELCLML